MLFEIIFAIFITRLSLVFCNIIYSIIPLTFTIPVILISPMVGSFLFTPKPGFKGPFYVDITYPINMT